MENKGKTATMVKVLLLESNPSFRQALATFLKSHFPSIRLEVALTVKEGMDSIGTFLPHLILLDFKLSDGTGLDFTRWLKTHHPAVKVVLLSSNGSSEYRQAAYTCGIDYFLLKESPPEDYLGLLEWILAGLDGTATSGLGSSDGTDPKIQ
jgi:DNA-binding NarL/FixJ family response regulator